MSSLFRKELSNLSPLALMFTVFFGANVLEAPINTRLLGTSWFRAHPGLDNSDLLYWFAVYIMGLSFAYSLFPREYEERTIEFLHTLPITRRQIFLNKLAAAAACVVFVALCQEVLAFGLQCFNENSLTADQFVLRNSAVLLLKTIVLAWVGLCHGLLASLGRHFGIYCIVFGAWGLDLLSARFPQVEVLKPTSLGVHVFHGTDLEVPWKAVFIHLLIALTCLLLSEYLWSRRGHQATHFIAVRVKEWPKLTGCLTAIVFVVFLIFWAFTVSDDDFEGETAESEGFSTYLAAHATTENYEFTFPMSLREPALGLVARADKIYSDLYPFLGGAEQEDRILADLTDVSHEHLGIASGGNLKVDLTDSQEPGMLDHILCHETAHVLAFRLSGQRGFDYARLLAAFHEGTASYYAYKLTDSSRRLLDSRRHALASYKRHDLELEDLFDSSALEFKVDNTAQYTLGELWVAAIVKSHGEDAPKKIWKAINRDAPDDMEPAEFWRDTFQAAGVSLERTRASFEQMLTDLEEQESEFLEILPDLSVRADREADDMIIIRGKASKEFPEDWPGLVLRIRERGFKEAWALEATIDPEDRRTIVAKVPSYYGNDFDYQIGIIVADDGYPIVNEWRQASNL